MYIMAGLLDLNYVTTTRHQDSVHIIHTALLSHRSVCSLNKECLSYELACGIVHKVRAFPLSHCSLQNSLLLLFGDSISSIHQNFLNC